MSHMQIRIHKSVNVALLAAFGMLGSQASAATCESIKSVSLGKAVITATESVAAGKFVVPGGGQANAAMSKLPAFCRVSAILHPSADSDIRIEVWLPEKWNNKLLSVGNGAFAGTITYNALAGAVAAGYAGASTDTGHQGNSPEFILGHPEKLTDFAYRAVHEMTVAAKAIAKTYYGSAPKYAYFSGCSTGGRQALMEAQRFPDDYDGIIAGATASYTSRLQGTQVWVGQMAHTPEAAYIPPAKYAMVHAAVLAACDALDGVKDGVLENPMACNFEPGTLACKDADGPSCLTTAQVELARKIYAGPKNPRTQEQVFPGYERGAELGWSTLAGPQPMSFGIGMYKYVIFGDPNWNYLTLDMDKDIARADRVAAPLMNAVNPDLRPFFAHGGKLLHYHGWSDPGIPPRSGINYYQEVAKTLGGVGKIDNSYRLFLVPGMGHCGGGDGTSTFDMASALDRWVDQGQAPEMIPASRIRDGKADRTRPLCPYPQVAAYSGSGSTDDAANFSCKAAR